MRFSLCRGLLSVQRLSGAESLSCSLEVASRGSGYHARAVFNVPEAAWFLRQGFFVLGDMDAGVRFARVGRISRCRRWVCYTCMLMGRAFQGRGASGRVVLGVFEAVRCVWSHMGVVFC